MNKGNAVHAKRFGLLGLAMVAVLGIMVNMSVSKYAISKEQDQNLDSAAWVIDISNVSETKTSYSAETLVVGKSAPGTEGTFTIALNAAGTETGVKYDISFTDIQNKPTNMYFMADGVRYDSFADLATGISGTIDANAANKSVSKVITWKWDYETSGNGKTVAENDAIDSADAGKTLTFTAHVVATQVRPAN